MKLFYKLTLSVLFTINAFGQFNENFDSSAALPAGWITYSGANNLGSIQNWATSSTHYHTANRGAHVHYENVSGGLAEDWLVTPQINLSGYSGCILSFYGSETYPTQDYGTNYTVKVSTTSQTDRNSFTTIATYGETDFGYSQPMTNQKTVDLSAYNGQQIYIAFVMKQDDGDNWTIDDVTINGTLTTQEFDQNNSVTVFPNPVKEIVRVTLNEEVETLQIIDLTGKTLKQIQNESSINTSDLAAGAYFLKIQSKEQKTYLRKIIKK